MNRLRLISIFFSIFILTACGFHLRGSDSTGMQLPFESIYLKAPAETTFVSDLKRAIKMHKINLVASEDEADLTLEVVSERAEKQIQSLSGGGRVKEYVLYYRVALRAYDKEKEDWLSAEEILLSRILPYDDSQILAKEQEEALLYRDMRRDAVGQAMRRLSYAKPQ